MSASLAAAAAALPMSSARMPSVRYPLAVLIGADSVPDPRMLFRARG
jgi:hypothetical protein